MNITLIIGVATAVTGLLAASLVARAFRKTHDVARNLAARGAGVQQIARRTRLPQDVIVMLLAGSAMPATTPRQNVPTDIGRRASQDVLRLANIGDIARKAS